MSPQSCAGVNLAGVVLIAEASAICIVHTGKGLDITPKILHIERGINPRRRLRDTGCRSEPGRPVVVSFGPKYRHLVPHARMFRSWNAVAKSGRQTPSEEASILAGFPRPDNPNPRKPVKSGGHAWCKVGNQRRILRRDRSVALDGPSKTVLSEPVVAAVKQSVMTHGSGFEVETPPPKSGNFRPITSAECGRQPRRIPARSH